MGLDCMVEGLVGNLSGCRWNASLAIPFNANNPGALSGVVLAKIVGFLTAQQSGNDPSIQGLIIPFRPQSVELDPV